MGGSTYYYDVEYFGTQLISNRNPGSHSVCNIIIIAYTRGGVVALTSLHRGIEQYPRGCLIRGRYTGSVDPSNNKVLGVNHDGRGTIEVHMVYTCIRSDVKQRVQDLRVHADKKTAHCTHPHMHACGARTQ